MMGSKLLLIFLGGGLGSVCRYIIGKYSLQFFSGNFPLGTFISNTLSCTIVGVVVYLYLADGFSLNRSLSFLLITGFCGGLSTFSTFSFENFELLKNGFYFTAILNVLLSVLVGIAAIYMMYKSAS